MNDEMDVQALTELLRASVALHADPDRSPLTARWHMELLESDFAGGRFLFAFDLKTDMRNPLNTLHGGATAGLLDTAMGLTARCYARDQLPAVTSELNISYLRPVPLPAKVQVAVTVLKAGVRLIRLRAEAFFPGAPERPLACALGTFCGK